MIRYEVSDGVCVLRLDAPPLNAFTFSDLQELRDAIRRANADATVRGIVLVGNAHHFSAGADIHLFQQIGRDEDAVRTSRLFQEAFAEVEDSTKPVVAAVAGRMLGGALELAMACHFRVCTNTTRFGMPEINLGINPGGGGCQRLPRLIGALKALDMLLTAKRITAPEALQLGLVDAVCDGRQLIETAREVLQSAAPRRKTSERLEKIADRGENDAALGQAEKFITGVPSELVAPRKIIEAVKAGLEESFQAGILKEREAFVQCTNTPATRNKIYMFFATRQTSKIPDLADIRPAPIAKAAVIGMGSMGTGIAHALIIAGVPVAVYDKDPTVVEEGMQRIQSSLEKRVGQGKLSADRARNMLALVTAATNYQELGQIELVIEAVFEDVKIKRALIERLETVCGEQTIIASNTSTISLDELAEGMQHRERLVGMHFFNPAHRMPLVEIIHHNETSEEVMATAVAFAKAIRKTPVLVKNREGFLVNRVFIPYLKEAFWLLEDGAEADAIDAAMVQFGFPMGPLTLIDMAGLDILAFTDRVLNRVFPDHGALSPVAVRLVERGHLGQKTGAGVYQYDPDDYTPHRSPRSEHIIAEVQREKGLVPRQIDADEITRRLVLRMVNEAFYVMEEGIARRESDLDVAMVLGTGFPDYRGGILKYAHDLGDQSVLKELEELAERFGRRFSPCQLLRKRKGN